MPKPQMKEKLSNAIHCIVLSESFPEIWKLASAHTQRRV